jgi:hypothetical protein
MQRSPRSIADYDEMFEPIRKARREKSGKQLGDPAKAAKAILTFINSPTPPAHLLLGSDALALVRDKLASMTADIDTWEDLSRSTDG